MSSGDRATSPRLLDVAMSVVFCLLAVAGARRSRRAGQSACPNTFGIEEVEANLGRFIAEVYNAKWLHSSLNCLPPTEFEAVHANTGRS